MASRIDIAKENNLQSRMSLSQPGANVGNTSIPNHINQELFETMIMDVIKDLNSYGVCCIDKFISRLANVGLAEKVREEVIGLHKSGQMEAGRVGQGESISNIRSDQIALVTGREENLLGIKYLMKIVDYLVFNAARHPNSGRLAQYSITTRTKAMAACYPGGKSRYLKHVDNPDRNGRVVTAIYYLNKQWEAKDGGQLVIYTCHKGRAVVNPLFDRLTLFFSGYWNPHEVRPAVKCRYALTLWYFDTAERLQYLERIKQERLINLQKEGDIRAVNDQRTLVDVEESDISLDLLGLTDFKSTISLENELPTSCPVDSHSPNKDHKKIRENLSELCSGKDMSNFAKTFGSPVSCSNQNVLVCDEGNVDSVIEKIHPTSEKNCLIDAASESINQEPSAHKSPVQFPSQDCSPKSGCTSSPHHVSPGKFFGAEYVGSELLSGIESPHYFPKQQFIQQDSDCFVQDQHCFFVESQFPTPSCFNTFYNLQPHGSAVPSEQF